jgi:diphthamide synthase subunit DPH2
MSSLNLENNMLVKKEDVEQVVKEKASLKLSQEDIVNYATHRQIEDLETARRILHQAYIQAELLYNDAEMFAKVKNPARTMTELLQTKIMIAEKLASLSNATDKLKPKQEQVSTPLININITTQKSIEDFIVVEVEE